MGYEHLSKDVFDEAVEYGKRFAKKCHAECFEHSPMLKHRGFCC